MLAAERSVRHLSAEPAERRSRVGSQISGGEERRAPSLSGPPPPPGETEEQAAQRAEEVGPIRRRMRGYILTMDQSDTGSV
eukprot:2699623-Pyramimonas_sp.AAC.1